MKLGRFLKHVLTPAWFARRAFPRSALTRIGEAIRSSEEKHDGELRFVIEGPFSPRDLFRRRPALARAKDLFARLRVWDTEHNSGVLIYVQLVDRRIEIVADRGINAKVEQAEWESVCRAMEASFRTKVYAEGALAAIGSVTRILARHFPPRATNPNELPDIPVVL
jgi:uncharacterized membrane protein